MMIHSNGRLLWVGIIFLSALLLLPAGSVGAQDSPLVVQIDWPNEGETLYAGPSSLLYSVPVEGHVQGAEQVNETVVVNLEIVQNGVTVAERSQPLQAGGTFSFNVTVNPDASQGQFAAEQSGCIAGCHFASELAFPAGPVLLRASLTNPDSLPHTPAERRITVDRSSIATIPVTVLLDDPAQTPVPGVQVSAATRLYLWRARHELAATNNEGQASLQVEALLASPTTYVLDIRPTVVEGILYESNTYEPVEVTLPPGASTTPPVTFTITARQGEITGQVLSTRTDLRPGTVWAICLPDGQTFQTRLGQDAAFQFNSLPVDQYVLTLDPIWLMAHDRESASVPLDLTETPTAHVDLALQPAGTVRLSGRVVTDNGDALPFAWVYDEADRHSAPVLPVDGRYMLPVRPDSETTMMVTAPGFYSRALLVEPDSAGSEKNVALTIRPDSEKLAWGQGELLLPADSHYRIVNDQMVLEYGWLWGHNETDSSLIIQAEELVLAIAHGRFALDFRPPETGWFYLPEGQATITYGQNMEVEVAAGQMVNLLNEEGLKAVPFEPVAFAVLGDQEETPIAEIWEPTLQAQFRDRLALIGVGAAQSITFVTYFLLLLSLLVVPSVILYFRWKGRRNIGINTQSS